MKIDWLGYAAMIVALICASTLVFLLWHRMTVAAGETQADVARSYNVSQATVSPLQA